MELTEQHTEVSVGKLQVYIENV